MTAGALVASAVAAAASSPAELMREPLVGHDVQVLTVAAIGIAILVLLIVWLKMHAFLALTIGALFVGIGSGVPLVKVVASYETGVGGVLGYVGVLIALGAMLGKLLADSGGADRIVDTLGNVPPEMMSASFDMLRPVSKAIGQVRLWDNMWDDEFVKSFRMFDRWGADQIPFPGECFRQNQNLFPNFGKHSGFGAMMQGL